MIWLRASGLSPAVLGAARSGTATDAWSNASAASSPRDVGSPHARRISGTPVGQTGWTGVDLVDGLDVTARVYRRNLARFGAETESDRPHGIFGLVGEHRGKTR